MAAGDPIQAIAAVGQISTVPMILRVISGVTGLRLSMIAHVTDTEWTCCAVNDEFGFGVEVGGKLDLAATLCGEIRTTRAPIVISHVARDAVYADHPVPKLYKFESYIAVPIYMHGGEYFGNMCALDANPTDLKQPKTLAMFQLFAQLVGLQLDAEAQRAETSQALLDATQAAELREQFIAVLGHDLRTPLQSIAIGNDLMTASHDELPAWVNPIVERMKRSVDRITRLVDDVLDFARGRLGSGIPLQASEIPDPLGMLAHVVDELRAVHPGRAISVHSEGHGSMHGDPVRLAQLLQNVLGNALTHSPAAAQVAVLLVLRRDALRLSVSNGGPALPDDVRLRMFEPYRRGTETKPAGLGLGLYISAQIVRSHHGTIEVTSVAGATTVTCSMPR